MVMIKKYNLLLAILICLPFAFTSCSDDDDVPTSLIPASDKGVYTDERDGNEYQWVRYGNLEWMAENFRYDLRDEDYCRVYSGDSRTVDPKVYGRLETPYGRRLAEPGNGNGNVSFRCWKERCMARKHRQAHIVHIWYGD